MLPFAAGKCALDGDDLESIGAKGLLEDRQCQSREDWDYSVEEANLVNAKASTGEVTFSAKNVKFRALTAKAESFAV